MNRLVISRIKWLLIPILFVMTVNVNAINLDTFVEIPELPHITIPIRKTGENFKLFTQRVQALHEARAKEIFPIQRAFRLEVEDRNSRLLPHEVKQSPSLLDPYEPIYLAYQDIDSVTDSHDELARMLETDQKKFKSNSSWLVIISIEDYLYADNVLFANRTAKMVKKTFQKKLDISNRNILMLSNKEASLKNINNKLRKFLQRVQRNDVIYFYFCGHGLSNKNGEQLILPYDGMPDFRDNKNTIKIERLYSKFLNSRALRTFSFIDASFNGVTDGSYILKGLESSTMRPRSEGYHKRLNILNSARSQDTSNAYYSKGYRLFSYFLAKEVLSTPQNAGELFDNIRTEIRKVSRGYGDDYVQEPEFFGYRELSIQK